jgi:hypothetical protein
VLVDVRSLCLDHSFSHRRSLACSPCRFAQLKVNMLVKGRVRKIEPKIGTAFGPDLEF